MESVKSMWIDSNENTPNIGFLVEINDENHGGSYFRLYDSPLRTNISREPKLFGWCGSYNNISKTAHGIWRAVKSNPSQDRVKIEEVTDSKEIKDFLEESGYPELF